MWFLWDFDQRQIFSVYSLRMWPLHVMDTYTLYRDSYLYLCTFRILLCIEFMWNNIVFGLVCFNTWPSTSRTTCTACKWYILCSYCNILCGSNPCGLYSEKYRLFFIKGSFNMGMRTLYKCTAVLINDVLILRLFD